MKLLKFNNKKGFTLIEMLTVIAILGILVLLAAPKFLGYAEKAEMTKIKTGIKSFETAVEIGQYKNPELKKDFLVLTEESLDEMNENGVVNIKGETVKDLSPESLIIPMKPSNGFDSVNWKGDGVFILNSDDTVRYYKDAEGITGEISETVSKISFLSPISQEQTRIETFSLQNLKEIKNISTNTGYVEVLKTEGDQVTVQIHSGASVSTIQTGGTFYPEERKSVVETVYWKNVQSQCGGGGQAWQASMEYNEDGFSGLLRATTSPKVVSRTNLEKCGETQTGPYTYEDLFVQEINYSLSYEGEVTKPETDERIYSDLYSYELTFEYSTKN